MALPRGGDVPWPPKSAQPDYDIYREHAAWYGGSAQALQAFYTGSGITNDRTTFFDQNTTAQPSSNVLRKFFFWARQEPGQPQRGRYHVPIPADISTTSADQLFSDEPRLLIPQAHAKRASKDAKKIQDRLDTMVNEDGLINSFHEAAEVTSALGGGYLQAHWDKEFHPRPLLQVIHPDSAIPTFQWGKLVSVIFWRYVETSGSDTWRHLESHEPGLVTHGLYKGTRTKLGQQKSLNSLPDTSLFVGVADPFGRIETGLKTLDCVYVPNMRPNRQRRGSDLGRSDYDECEGLFDSADETLTSWMRDIRLGKARMFVAEEFVKSQGRGKGSAFSFEQEIYEMLKMTPQAGDAVLTPNQFAIRVDEHERTLTNLIERAVTTAGFSGSTFGLKEAVVQERTATEVMAREHRTVVTRGKKIRYWSRAVSDILEIMLAIDQMVFEGPGVMRPRADFPESVHDSLKDTSQAILQLDQARAISRQTKVEMAHPTWDPDEVTAEVERLKSEAPAPSITSPAAPAGAPPSIPGGGNQ